MAVCCVRDLCIGEGKPKICLPIVKHMLRLRRDGEINGQHVPEIILLNSHDGTSSYQMLPGYFRFVCQNGWLFKKLVSVEI